VSNDRGDGSKLSFAERDKLRRQRGDRRDSRRGSSRKSGHAEKSYKAALERAFADGRVAEFAATLSRSSAPPALELPKQAKPEAPAATPAAAAPIRRPAVDTEAQKTRAERRTLIDKLKHAEGGGEVRAAVDRFVAKCGALPNDYELLAKALAHPDSAVVIGVLHQLIERLDGDKPRRSRSLALQLEILQDTGDNAEVRELAHVARGKL